MGKTQKLPPYGLVQAIGGIRGMLLNLHRKLFPGSVVLYETFQSFWLMQPLFIAAELDIAGILRDGPLSAEQIARKTGTDAAALYRILRTLAGSGIFKELEGKRFAQNSRSGALLDGNGSMRNMIIHHLGKINWEATGNLMHTVRTGENAFRGLHGTDIYPYLQKDHDEMMRFERSMSDLSALALDPVLARFDFSKYPAVADIGGGEGMLLARILESNPGIRGVVFDLPENAAKAAGFITSSGLGSRMGFMPGSFLEPFGLEADLYIMKNVLHNWGDADCRVILSNLRKTMPAGAVLLILEMLVPKPGIGSYARLVDMQMLATMPGGIERTAAEFKTLLSQSGFRLKKIIPTIAPLSILMTVGE